MVRQGLMGWVSRRCLEAVNRIGKEFIISGFVNACLPKTADHEPRASRCE